MKNKIRVCIPMPYLYPLFNKACDAAFGGAEVDMYNVAKKLAQDSRYDITALVADFGQPRIEHWDGVKVQKIRRNIMVNPTFIDKIIKYFSLIWTLLFSRQDIYLTKTASELDGWVAFFACGIRRKKHVHRLASDKDTRPETYIPTEGKRFYRLHWYGLHRTDLILAQSQFQKEDLLEHTGLESTVINNGFFLPQVPASEKEYILWVSRADTIKRAELFLELAKRAPQEQFVLIMPVMKLPNPKVQQAVQQYADYIIAQAQNLSNVRYIPFVPFHKIQPYYNRAKLFVNTSEFEGFPNTFIQACIGHTPILSFGVNPGGFITKNKLGFVCDEDIEKGAAFINTLRPDVVQELGGNAAAYIQKNHNIENTIMEYKREFEALMKK